MNPEDNRPEAGIERAISEIRGEAIDPAVMEAAGAATGKDCSVAGAPKSVTGATGVE